MKRIVVNICSSIRCIKSGNVICYRGLKFHQRTVFLLVLESDAACTSLNGHSTIKSAVFGFSVML